MLYNFQTSTCNYNIMSPVKANNTVREVTFGYSFPAIRGIQANREYYVSMCPIRLIPKLFLFNSEELPPELRVQRRLNKSRLPEITSYIVNNQDSYVLSAITSSIDGNVKFSSLNNTDGARNIGMLHVAMEAKFIINDGQHRRAAIEKALAERTELGDESIAVVFFLDPRLKRCQQMFADLNRYAIRTSTSLGILYDHRDGQAILAKRLIKDSAIFRNLVEPERNTLSARSKRLFTLGAIYGATNDLLAGLEQQDVEKLVECAASYWEEVANQIKEWNLVYQGKLKAGEVRTNFIHSHGVVLKSLGKVGNMLLLSYPQKWKKHIKKLSKTDWHRTNPNWEGRALIGGRVSKAQQNVLLTTNFIKKQIGLPLSPEEQKAEDAFNRRNNGKK